MTNWTFPIDLNHKTCIVDPFEGPKSPKITRKKKKNGHINCNFFHFLPVSAKFKGKWEWFGTFRNFENFK